MYYTQKIEATFLSLPHMPEGSERVVFKSPTFFNSTNFQRDVIPQTFYSGSINAEGKQILKLENLGTLAPCTPHDIYTSCGRD